MAEMIEAAENIRLWMTKVSEPIFREDQKLRSAVGMQLIVLGEGAYHLTPAARHLAPAVPWDNMAGMRHRLAHGYAQASLEILWETARDRVPALIPELRRLADALGPELD